MIKRHTDRVASNRETQESIPEQFVARLHNIGPLVRQLRVAKDISLTDMVTKKVVSDKSVLSKYETEALDIPLPMLKQIISALGCPPQTPPLQWFFKELKKYNIDTDLGEEMVR